MGDRKREENNSLMDDKHNIVQASRNFNLLFLHLVLTHHPSYLYTELKLRQLGSPA